MSMADQSMRVQERNSMLAIQPDRKYILRRISNSVLIGLLLAICLFNLPVAGAFRSPLQNGAQTIETGKFRLHKFQQAIGEESYTVTREGDALVMKSDFKF